MRALQWVGLLGLVNGCVLPAIDLEGKACPCAEGWVCDEATQTCRMGTAESGGGTTGIQGSGSSASTGVGATTDASTTTAPGSSSDGSETTGGPIPGRFEVLSFSADWSTPESIHWTWDVAGDEADFRGWVLWLATDEAALESGDGVLVFDGETNPELDRFTLKNTKGVDRVVASLTRGLEPGTDYYAKLVVLDTAGGRSESPNVAVRSTTDAPTEDIVLFDEEQLSGGAYPLPTCFGFSDEEPYAGSSHYQLDLLCHVGEMGMPEQTCDTPDPRVVECWENLRLQEFSVPLTGLSGGDLADAFLEFHISVDPGEAVDGHGWWSSAGVQIGGQGFGFWPLTIPATREYERFQIPLSVLGVTLDDLASPADRVYAGSVWQNGSTLRFDEARIRW